MLYKPIKTIEGILEKKMENRLNCFLTEDEFNEFQKHSVQNFVVSEHFVFFLKIYGKKNEREYYALKLASYLKITKAYQDVVTSARKYEVEYFDGQVNKTVIFTADILSLQGVRQLLNYGVIFSDENINIILRYLSFSASVCSVISVHSSLGWLFENNKTVFLSNKAYGDIDSIYNGSFSLEPKGSLNDWLDMVKSEVLGNTALEFSLLTGFTSILHSYINHRIDVGNIIINLTGQSSTGKTTAALLAASCYGSPVMGKALVATLNSTPDGLIQLVSSANGHTVVLDEGGTADKRVFERLLYTISAGVDKRRLNKDGSAKKVTTFSSLVLVTSEFPIMGDNPPSGINVRGFEINKKLTKSGESADKIKECVYSNYGVAGVKFTSFILTKKDNILNTYKKISLALKAEYKVKSAIELRALGKLAIIMTTAAYFNACFKDYSIQINTDNLKTFIFEMVGNIPDSEKTTEKAIEALLQYVNLNKSYFLTSECDEYSSNTKGKYIQSGGRIKLFMLKDVAEAVLTNAGFQNIKEIFQLFDKNEMLIRERDRLCKRVKLSKNLPPAPCYIIDINNKERGNFNYEIQS